MARSSEPIAFDWNIGAIGVLYVDSETFEYFEGSTKMERAADLVFGYDGRIVSFNGKRKDLDEMRSILADAERQPVGEHVDMSVETSKIRWPPDPGTSPILGEDLDRTFAFFGGIMSTPPQGLDDYGCSVWQDCFQTSWLYKRWVARELTSERRGV